MEIIITTNEPESIKNQLRDTADLEVIEMPMGFDMMMATEAGMICIERKTPLDFIASVMDGRLYNEILAMREENPAVMIILIHGEPEFDLQDFIIIPGNEPNDKSWTRKAFDNALRTIKYVEGCFTETCSDDDYGLPGIIKELYLYFDKSSHNTVSARPGITSDWLEPTIEERAAYFYQGIPGMGPKLAKTLAIRYPVPKDLMEAGLRDIRILEGFGEVKSYQVHDFIRGVDRDES